MSICDVIVMLKWRHHVTYMSQRIQDFLEAFSFIMFGEQEKNP